METRAVGFPNHRREHGVFKSMLTMINNLTWVKSDMSANCTPRQSLNAAEHGARRWDIGRKSSLLLETSGLHAAESSRIPVKVRNAPHAKREASHDFFLEAVEGFLAFTV